MLMHTNIHIQVTGARKFFSSYILDVQNTLTMRIFGTINVWLRCQVKKKYIGGVQGVFGAQQRRRQRTNWRCNPRPGGFDTLSVFSKVTVSDRTPYVPSEHENDACNDMVEMD
jgi:hypothetical protein